MSTPTLKKGFLQAPYGDGRGLLCRLDVRRCAPGVWTFFEPFIIAIIGRVHGEMSGCTVLVDVFTLFCKLHDIHYMKCFVREFESLLYR